MSRSYCKAQSYFREIRLDKSFRAKNRQCIKQEIKNPYFGDVVFPVYKECYDISRGKNYRLKKEIRDEYFLGIRNILNGYSSQNGDPYDKAFIEIYTKIKCLIPDYWLYREYEWLGLKEIRKVIKTWSGKPLEVLSYLAHQGLIEKAVCLKTKLAMHK